MQALPSTEKILSTYDGFTSQQIARSEADLQYEGQAYAGSAMAGDSTFGRDDVNRMMNGQLQALLGAARKSNEGIVESSRALMQAILRENDRQRVAVDIDAGSVLNEGSSLSPIDLAEQKLGSTKGSRLAALPPVNSSDTQAKQLAEAHSEIVRLNERMRAMAAQFEAAMSDKSRASEAFLSMQDTVSNMQSQQAEMTQQQQQRMQEQNARYQEKIKELEGQNAELHRELSGKLAHSTQFTTLKRMLNEKNELAKKLRTALSRYDPAAAAAAGGADDDIEAADDDDD